MKGFDVSVLLRSGFLYEFLHETHGLHALSEIAARILASVILPQGEMVEAGVRIFSVVSLGLFGLLFLYLSVLGFTGI